MILKYGEDKYFIGIVKFFDSNKGFGFIASNSCGMNEPIYNQDFYVNSSSFIEQDAAKEGAIVVFQVEQQSKFKTRAVNVRYIKKSEEDQRRALAYYGPYEKIALKEREVNLFNHIAKPRSMELEFIRNKIVTYSKRSPEATLKHFSFYVSHFKEKDSALERYIFDRDFERAQKEDWIALFSALNGNETNEIAKAYPSIFRYIDIVNLKEVICDYITRNADNDKELNYINTFIVDMSTDIKEAAHKQLEQIADKQILSVLDSYAKNTSLWENIDKAISRTKHSNVFWRNKNVFWRNKSVRHWIEVQLRPLTKLTNRNFETEIDVTVQAIHKNKFSSLLDNYNDSSRPEQLKLLIEAFESLSEDNKESNEGSLKRKVETNFQQATIECRYYDVIKIFDLSATFGSDFTNKLKSIFSPLACKNHCEWNDFGNIQEFEKHIKHIEECASLFSHDDLSKICEYCIKQITESKSLETITIFEANRTCFGDTYTAECQQKISASLCLLLNKKASQSISSKYIFSKFFAEYYKFVEVLCANDKSNIISHVQSLIDESSLDILSEFSKHDDFQYGLPDDYIISKVKSIVNNWRYVNFSNCFYEPDYIFIRFPELRNYVAKRGLELICKFKLTEGFDGEENTYSYRSAESRNCFYLKNMAKFVGKYTTFEPLANYISSRSADEQLILFDNGVISQLPSNITENIINQISIDDVLAPTKRWYNPPKLKNELYNKILSSATDLFTLIEKKLVLIEEKPENVPLIVLLVELLKANSPKEPDKSWQDSFDIQIKSLSQRHLANRTLQIVLWAVYIKTYIITLPIADIFPYLPPYLQIKMVKWLFLAKSANRIPFTANSLFKYIGGNNKAICFSVAIVLEYLKLRENEPSATLTHNDMLRLLQDREDHSEWVGIRQFVHDCQGRYNIEFKKIEYDRWGNPKQNERWRFYNGIAYKKDGKIVLFVPRRMVNEKWEQQDYNNKIFDNICQYLTLAFHDVKFAQNNQGLFFFLNEEYDLQVRSLVRMYNFRYGDLHNELINFSLNNNDIHNFCECRMSNKPDRTGFAFYWCANRPCFRFPVRYHLNSEWKEYTILDFLRILGIPTDYTNKQGKTTRFGYYIILSSYLRSFAKFYEHLKCRGCGKLMKPAGGVSNFATRAVTEFSCDNPDCSNFGMTVYLNHCFNKRNCDATIDSRDSKKCPNGQYICPECGACCSTQNFANRLSNLQYTGGYISPWLVNFVRNDLGHWEKHQIFCYKCGTQLENGECPNCHIKYKK